MPILDLGLLSECLELGRFQLSDLVLEELFLEGDFLAVGREQLLGQIGAAGNSLFRLGNRVEEILVAGRRVGNDHCLCGVFEGRFLFLDQLLLGVRDRLLLDGLGHVGTGLLLQRLDELLFVLENADTVLLLGCREFLAHQSAVVHAGLQLVEQLDGLLLGHVEGDAVLLRHLLELLGGHALQPLGGRNLRHLSGEQLGLFEFRLLQSEQLDQFVLGPQQADLVFLELGAERRSGQVTMIDSRLGQIEQLDEIGLGPGNGHAVLFRQGLELFDRQRAELGDVAIFKGALELGVLLGLGIGHAFQHVGRENAGVPLRCLGGGLGNHLAAADGHRPGHDVGAAAMRMRGLLGELVDGKGLAVQAATDRAHALVFHSQPFQLLDADPLVELEPAHVVGAEDLGAGDHLHAVLGLAEHPASGLAEGILVDDHLAHVPDDIVGSLARGDAVQDGALDAV